MVAGMCMDDMRSQAAFRLRRAENSADCRARLRLKSVRRAMIPWEMTQ